MSQLKTDPLTGLACRQDFSALYEEAVKDAQGMSMTLALVDVDNFKRINDEHGHQAGDLVLVFIASKLATIAGSRLIRYGGDEFVVLFAGIEREQAFLRLEKVREQIESKKELAVDGKTIALLMTISVGAAAMPIDGSSESELMRKADGALYRAKIGGRNKVMLAFEERMAPKTSHFTLTQLERLAELARDQGIGEAVLLREALDDLLVKYLHGFRK